EGALFVAEVEGRRIRKIAPDGTITTIWRAADPNNQYIRILDVAVDSCGIVYFSSHNEHCVYRMEPDPTFIPAMGCANPLTPCEYLAPTVFAGQCGQEADAQAVDYDGSLATDAKLSFPGGLAIANDGSVFFSEGTSTGNGDNNAHDAVKFHRIWKVGTDGRLARIAGTDHCGCDTTNDPSACFGAQSGDPLDENTRALAREVNLCTPEGLDIADDGTLYFLSTIPGRIFKIDGTGFITHVNAVEADGTSLILDHPRGIKVSPSGRLFIGDRKNNRIIAVDANGAAVALAGTGDSGKGEEGNAALQTQLNGPVGTALAPDGSIYISDTENNRILKLQSPRTGFKLGSVSVMSPSGDMEYVFDPTGRHESTIDVATQNTIHTFLYSPMDGMLSQIQTRLPGPITAFRNTHITRSANQIDITGHYGQTTTLVLNPQGYIRDMIHPGSLITSFGYSFEIPEANTDDVQGLEGLLVLS
ncbi:MAG: hypothetical protein JJ974_13020, partial [Phycisphaerales bacterium]|nr:hypothetical protein [Phycisphaerales bacterium]